jgi:hypothetical protein
LERTNVNYIGMQEWQVALHIRNSNRLSCCQLFSNEVICVFCVNFDCFARVS